MSKKHYKLDRSDASRRAYRDAERELEEAKAYGFITWKELHIVPLREIEPQKVWNPPRIERIREGIERGVALPAVSLARNEGGRYKYSISDGIHRYNASVEAGFTHIPAMITFSKETPELLEEPKVFQEGTYVRFKKPIDGFEVGYLVENIFGDVFVTVAGNATGAEWIGDIPASSFEAEIDPPRQVKEQIQGHWFMQKTSSQNRVASTALSTYINRLTKWDELVAPFLRAESGRLGDRRALIGGFNVQFFFLILLREKQGGGRRLEDLLPTEAEGSIYVNQTGGPALNKEMAKLALKMEKPASVLLNDGVGDAEFERAYKSFMKHLKAYTERAKSLVDTSSSEILYEKFTWKGIRFEVQGFTEKEVRVVLDNLSWVLDLFKRRGMDKAIPEALRSVLLTDEKHTFVSDRTNQTMVGHGLYESTKKRITLRKDALGSGGRMLKRWLAEIFIHEFGHHVHLSILPREAREFWDSGWEKVEEAMQAKEDAKKIFPEDRLRFIKLIQEADYDFQAVGRTLTGLDRMKYVAYLNLRGIINGTKNVRLNDEGRRLQSIGRDPESYVIDRGGMGLFTEEELAEVVPKEVARIMRHLEGRLGLRKSSFEYIPQKIVDQIAFDDKDVERALKSLGIPTEYGTTNVMEDFAETFVQFMVAPEKLDPVARWRMGRTLGMSRSLGTPVIKLTQKQENFPMHTKIAKTYLSHMLRARTAKNLPKKVEEYAKKFQDEGKDEGYAWALAWSIYCKHKNPDSPHCKADSYLDNQGKKSTQEVSKAVLRRYLESLND
jgi:hypothetical protein